MRSIVFGSILHACERFATAATLSARLPAAGWRWSFSICLGVRFELVPEQVEFDL